VLSDLCDACLSADRSEEKYSLTTWQLNTKQLCLFVSINLLGTSFENLWAK
jgi:hypothetical protein